jgi:hypothetical protein
VTPPVSQFRAAAELIPSRFYTMDLARQQRVNWRIVELGDGQVAGLPERTDAAAFYRAILNRLAKPGGGI